jgi:hypothetical protein
MEEMMKALGLCFVWVLLSGAIFTPVIHASASADGALPLMALHADAHQASTSPEMPAEEATTTPFPHPFAPLGVYGAHVIKPGKWLLAYTYGHMAMDGNLVKTDSVSNEALLKRYNVVPVKMDVNMHMVCLMRGMTEDLSLMVMIPYYFKGMTMIMRKSPKVAIAGVQYDTHSDGIGDLQLGGTYSLYRSAMHQLVFYGAISIPTGSIDVRDDTPAKRNAKLGYTMQLGSGTVDLTPALTYMGKWERLFWGAQFSGIARFYDNRNHYRWGNRYRLTGWLGYRLFSTMYYSCITSVRLDWQSMGNIQGADPELNPLSTPGADPSKRGGSRLDVLPGLSLYIDKGKLQGNRLFIEGGAPLYQYLDGPQGRTTWTLMAGWKFVF